MKKGFTLIELLAVIVILAIIALIATPIVLDIIEDSKKSSTLRSAEMYLDAVELSVANATLDNKKITDGTYSIMSDGNICLETPTDNTCPEDSTLKVEVNGEAPSSGTITIGNGEITGVYLNLSNQDIVKNEDGDLVYFEPICTLASDSTIIKTNIGAKYICNLGDTKETKNLIFYVLEDGDTPTLTDGSSGRVAQINQVSLIMDSNIGNITSTSELNSQTSNWTNTKIIKIGLPSAYQIARAVGDNTWSVMNAYVISNLPSWLTENLSSSSTESTNGYWTSTQASDSILGTFAVHYNAILTGTSSYTHNIDTTYKVGVRPVITVSKNDIKN